MQHSAAARRASEQRPHGAAGQQNCKAAVACKTAGRSLLELFLFMFSLSTTSSDHCTPCGTQPGRALKRAPPLGTLKGLLPHLFLLLLLGHEPQDQVFCRVLASGGWLRVVLTQVLRAAPQLQPALPLTLEPAASPAFCCVCCVPEGPASSSSWTVPACPPGPAVAMGPCCRTEPSGAAHFGFLCNIPHWCSVGLQESSLKL